MQTPTPGRIVRTLTGAPSLRAFSAPGARRTAKYRRSTPAAAFPGLAVMAMAPDPHPTSRIERASGASRSAVSTKVLLSRDGESKTSGVTRNSQAVE